MSKTNENPFDKSISESRKREGMARAAENNQEDLRLGQRIAVTFGKRYGKVHADQVGRYLYKHHGIKTLGPSAGALFPRSVWEHTGEYVKSARKTNHSRDLKVWRLK